METQENCPREPRITRAHLRGAAVGALAAALGLTVILLYPPIRDIFYKGFGTIETPMTFDYTFMEGSTVLTKYTGGTASVTVPAFLDGKPVKNLNSFVFLEQTYISSIVIEDGVTRIESFAVLACPSVTEITIPASVTEINANAFSGCAEDLTIYGKSGSEAEAYARQNEFRFAPN